jgi:hypothetical protein
MSCSLLTEAWIVRCPAGSAQLPLRCPAQALQMSPGGLPCARHRAVVVGISDTLKDNCAFVTGGQAQGWRPGGSAVSSNEKLNAAVNTAKAVISYKGHKAHERGQWRARRSPPRSCHPQRPRLLIQQRGWRTTAIAAVPTCVGSRDRAAATRVRSPSSLPSTSSR